MKLIINRVLLASATVIIGTAVHAGKNVVPVEAPVASVKEINPFYIGIGAIWSTTDVNCPCANGDRIKDTTYGYIVRLGYDFNQYIGIETRLLRTSISEDFSRTTHYGIYLKPQYHFNEALNIYGLLGYGKSEIDFSCATAAIEDYDDTGISIGIGFEYDLSNDEKVITSRAFDGQDDQERGLSLWVDYQNLLHNEGESSIKSNVVSAGIMYDF